MHSPEYPAGQAELSAGITPIADLNANDALGFSPLEFFVVTIEGVVQLGSGLLDPFDQASPSAWYYVAGGTGGIAIAHAGQITTPVASGQRVRVTALVLTQGLSPIAGTRTLELGFGMGSVAILGSGTPDPSVMITATELLTNGAVYEGARVAIGNLTVVDPGEWPEAGSSGFARVTDGSAEVLLYIDDDTDLDGALPPPTPSVAHGFVAQNDTVPFLDGHFVYLLTMEGPVSVEDSSWGKVKSIYR